MTEIFTAGERVPGGCTSLTSELSAELSSDLNIRQLESHEKRWKLALAGTFNRAAGGDVARRLARFQKETGLLRKYKSYGVKAATPLGYAIFLQRPGMGFSFQRHTVRKVEAFHILEVAEGARVFLCPRDVWERIYDPATFAQWLSGSENPEFGRWSVVPHPGDVYVIDDKDTVHSVLGCILEEYASVSVDVVERLHDQNEGLPVPGEFDRQYVRNAIRAITLPATHQRVSIRNGRRECSPIVEERKNGASRTVLVALPELTATFWRLNGSAVSSPVAVPFDRATQLFVHSGTGWLDIRGMDEPGFHPGRGIAFQSGETLMCAPGCEWRLRADSPLEIAEHTARWAPAVTDTDA